MVTVVTLFWCANPSFQNIHNISYWMLVVLTFLASGNHVCMAMALAQPKELRNQIQNLN